MEQDFRRWTMRRKTTLLGIGLAVTAVLSIGSPASAQTLCFGPSTAYVCVDPTGGTPINQCIYAGPPPCHPVSVPRPLVWCGGDLSCVRVLDILGIR